MGDKVKQIMQAMEFTKQSLDSISVTGAENCNKLVMSHKNISIFLNMLNNGEIKLSECSDTAESNDDVDKDK